MLPPVSDEIIRLVRSLFEARSLLDRVRRQDHRFATLKQIADSREVRVVPDLLPLLVADETLAPHVAAVISELVRDVSAVQLSWLDEQVRHGSYAQYWSNDWHKLPPTAISRLAHTYDLNGAVIGLLASHANGFVRAAALEVLAQYTSGQEIPFLSLRANDWVEPVAARASELLLSRLRPDNRQSVLNALPFIVRVLGQHRRDHNGIERALRSVLLSDGGEDALARGRQFATSVRRKMYELLMGGDAVSKRRLIDAALEDSDAVIRARALRSVATGADFEEKGQILERFLRDDRVPAVRRLTLSLLSELMPERILEVFPAVLLDRAASVRGLARFVAGTHQLALVPRAVYVQTLAAGVSEQLAAAIDGVGETGTREDGDLIAPFLTRNRPRIRRSALRALAKLDAERAISSAITALADDASSVRTAAVQTLSANASRVDFDLVNRRLRSLADPKARRNLLRVFLEAPKWEAPAFLLQALMDPDDGVRALATRLIDRWIESFNRNQTQPTVKQLQQIGVLLDSVATRLPEATANMLRFSIKPSYPTMAAIRIGFFEGFKGADTLLLDVDREGLKALIAWLRTATTSGTGIDISRCPGAFVQSGLHVDLSRAPNDRGLVRTARTRFVWQRSEEGWAEVIDKLDVMESGACHQYLEGPSDDVQVMASIGEYGDSWWRRHGS